MLCSTPRAPGARTCMAVDRFLSTTSEGVRKENGWICINFMPYVRSCSSYLPPFPNHLITSLSPSSTTASGEDGSTESFIPESICISQIYLKLDDEWLIGVKRWVSFIFPSLPYVFPTTDIIQGFISIHTMDVEDRSLSICTCICIGTVW